MATPNDIRQFFALAGFTITNRHLLMAKEALKTQRYGKDDEGNPREPGEADLVDWIYRTTKAFVNRHTEDAARAEVIIPDEDLLE